jgi:hypothetical protein
MRSPIYWHLISVATVMAGLSFEVSNPLAFALAAFSNPTAFDISCHVYGGTILWGLQSIGFCYYPMRSPIQPLLTSFVTFMAGLSNIGHVQLAATSNSNSLQFTMEHTISSQSTDSLPVL